MGRNVRGAKSPDTVCPRLLANQLVNFLRLLLTDGTDGPAAEADGTGETD